jgi:hypothetical protein
MLLLRVTQCYNYFMKNVIFYQAMQSQLRSIMSKQPTEFSLIKFELLSKMLLHLVTLSSNMH